MTEQRITLVRVDHNVQVGYRNGGSYSATVVHYLNSTGESKDKGVASSFLEGAVQLAQQLQAAVPNQSYILITEKSACGKYSNLIGLVPDDGRQLKTHTTAPKPVAQYQGGGAKGKSSSFDNVGAQIGNALTNAAAISPAGTTLADLGKTAEGIIRLGEILKQRHLAGAYAPKPPAPVQQVAPPTVQPVATTAPQAQVVVDSGTAFSDLIG